jgi:hypothetical protein
MDAGDVRQVKHVLQQKGRSWSHMMAFNFAYIASRVKRYIPTPIVLYHRVKAVFDFFMDKKDTLTGKPLFHAEAKKAAQRLLAAIRRGEFSDPPGVDFYVRKTNKYGKEMVDSVPFDSGNQQPGRISAPEVHEGIWTQEGGAAVQ